MNSKFIAEIKNNLIKQKEEILLKSNQRIDVDIDGDETDEVQANLLIEIANQLNTRDLNKIYTINNALNKINNQTYGKCEDCEEDIAEKRLLANPYFLTCVLCAEQREFDEKQKGKNN